MAEYTPNLALKKPSNSDYVRISDNNENMDVLDAEIKALQDAIEELESVEVINDLNHTDTDKALSANQGKVLDDKISTLTGRIANGEKTAAYEAKRLDNLIKLTQGKVFDYQTDATEAYSKTIPSGSQEYGALDVVGGKSLIWNQTAQKNPKAYSSTYSTIAYTDEKITHTIKQLITGYQSCVYVTVSTAPPLNHKCFLKVFGKPSKSCTLQVTEIGGIHINQIPKVSANANETVELSCVFDVITANKTRIMPQISAAGELQAGDTIEWTYPILIDLTQMFGAGNEPTLEQCKEIFSADYYPYNAGELMNFGVNEVETAGRNLLETTTAHFTKPTGYNGTWNSSLKNGALVIPTSSNYGAGGFGGVWIDCEPNTTYLLSGYAESDTNTTAYTCTRALSENGTFHNQTYATILSGNSGYFSISITTTENCDRLAFRLTGRYTGSSVRGKDFTFSNLMIEKVQTASATPSVYTPYRKETFTIPQNVLNLADYGASAGSVYNYIDFDRKVYVQNVESVDLGTLTWVVDATSAYTAGIQSTIKKDTPNFKCAKYVFGTNVGRGNLLEGQCGLNGHASTVFCVKDSNYTTASELQSALNGVILNYELATPIETDISQYIDNGLIFAEGNGTITFKNIHGDDYHISVPNKETYMVKLADAI